MKKLFISLCIALLGLCASAQEKGDMAVGLNLGVAPCLESGAKVTNFGIGAKFQYNVTNPIRLEADVDYWFKNKGMDVLDITANVHYIFNVGSKLKVYPLVGIGYARLGASMDFSGLDEDDWLNIANGKYDDDDFESSSTSKFLFNVGAGVEYPITNNLSVGAEIKYQYIQYFSRLPINIGVTYKF